MNTFEQHKAQKFQAGVIVFAILAVFTALEFAASQMGNWVSALQAVALPVLIVIALLKAFLVVRDYMHIGKVFFGEDEE